MTTKWRMISIQATSTNMTTPSNNTTKRHTPDHTAARLLDTMKIEIVNLHQALENERSAVRVHKRQLNLAVRAVREEEAKRRADCLCDLKLRKDRLRSLRPGRKIGTFLHPLAAMTSLLAMPHAKVVMSSIVWDFPSGGLTGPHVVENQLGSPWVYDRSIVQVVPQKGMANSIVASDTLVSSSTVLPNSAGTSLSGPSQGRNIDKRRKRVRPSSPLVEKVQEVVKPQPRFLVMSRSDDGENMKRVSPFILERAINGAAKPSVAIRKLRHDTILIQTTSDI
uniref:Uncharacterized protein n=1 Tax=Timema douglasi TaxID=61478 RepID=A0A7R8VUY6_TIMDO|nr:unnamed protein product [Timema douglasi]